MRWSSIAALLFMLGGAATATAQHMEVTLPVPATKPIPTPRWRIHGAIPLLRWSDSSRPAGSVESEVEAQDWGAARATQMVGPQVVLGLGFLWTPWLVTGATLEAGYDRSVIDIEGYDSWTVSKTLYGAGGYVMLFARVLDVRPFASFGLSSRWTTYDSGIPRSWVNSPNQPGPTPHSPGPTRVHARSERVELSLGLCVLVTEAFSIDTSFAITGSTVEARLGGSGWL